MGLHMSSWGPRLCGPGFLDMTEGSQKSVVMSEVSSLGLLHMFLVIQLSSCLLQWWQRDQPVSVMSDDTSLSKQALSPDQMGWGKHQKGHFFLNLPHHPQYINNIYYQILNSRGPSEYTIHSFIHSSNWVFLHTKPYLKNWIKLQKQVSSS